jgi:molybdopterin synthase sulfur carrier subunit
VIGAQILVDGMGLLIGVRVFPRPHDGAAISIYLAPDRKPRHMIRVNISGHLKDYTGDARKFEVDSTENVLAMVLELDHRFPGIRGRILDDQDKTRPYVNIFVNGQNARDIERERTRLRDGDVIHILPSVAGG